MTSPTKKAAVAAKKRKKDIRQHQLRTIVQSIDEPLLGMNRGSYCERPKKKRKKDSPKKRSRGVVLYRDEDDGKLKPMPPTMSSWYNLYCAEHCKELTPNFESKFRTRFSLPYTEFKKLVALCINNSMSDYGEFKRWRPGNQCVNGTASSPICHRGTIVSFTSFSLERNPCGFDLCNKYHLYRTDLASQSSKSSSKQTATVI